jgi:tight adherence protein B
LLVRTQRRQRAFANQLEETLQMLAGSLRAGYSLPQAAATVATEAEAPTSEEFARVINEARVGRSLIEAFHDAAVRVRSDDFYWIVQAITINREVGGNLAEVLEGVGKTIRERVHLRRQVEALASEGKLSAIILIALPPAVILLLSVSQPEYLARFGESALGIALLVVAAVLLIVGALWLRALVRIKF